MGTQVIVAKDLTKVYKMGEQEVCALCGVSLEIERGEVVSIMGGFGGAKSVAVFGGGSYDRSGVFPFPAGKGRKSIPHPVPLPGGEGVNGTSAGRF